MPESMLPLPPEALSESPDSPKHKRRAVPSQPLTHAPSPEAVAAIENEPILSFEEVRDALVEQVEAIQKQFKIKHRHLLRWAAKHGYTLHFLADVGGKAAMAGGLMASLLVSAPQQIAQAQLQQHTIQAQEQQAEQHMQQAVTARKKYQMTAQATAQQHAQQQTQLSQQLQDVARTQARTEDVAVQGQAASWVSQLTGVPATSELEGYRLQTSIGRIGAEQHLKRYPGDNLAEHEFAASGFAPGLGAYGYFAPSQAALTPDLAAKEKYYVAVQTFLSPNWAGHAHETYNWFKYRKVVVYDPWTNKAVVADVADAGPGAVTGKNFGGSPEVMAHLGAHDGYGSPPVMMFFVDDPGNKIPLGPVNFAVGGGS